MPASSMIALARVDQAVVAGHGLLDDLAGAGLGERRLDRRHHQRVAVVRAEVEHLAGGDEVHVLGLAAERADGEPAADRLGERDEVGSHAELVGGAAVPGGDAGLDLVEDEEGAVPLGDLPDRLQVAVVGQADADVLHHRFDDEAGDVAALERPLECFGVVVRDDDDVLERALGDAGRLRHRVGRSAGPARSRGGLLEIITSSWWPW
jgi:hypothetical protein